MTDVERIWMEITGKEPTDADMPKMIAVERIINANFGWNRQEKAREMVGVLERAIEEINEIYGFDLEEEVA